MIRRGTILIVVAGVATLLSALALAFLSAMRTDVEDTAVTVRESQARLMLVAACQYICEASRLGWDVPGTPAHEEAFGWIDVRDGKLGPKLVAGADDDSRFPVRGAPRRFPVHAVTLPPYAVSPAVAPNAIDTDRAAADFGMPYLRHPDPMPATANGWTATGSTVTAANWNAFVAGDPRPKGASVGKSWFRIYRQEADTFVVTCGGGGTRGFRSWTEVTSTPGAADEFLNDQSIFESARSEEVRLHFLVQWSPAVATSDLHNPHPCLNGGPGFRQEHYVSCPMNTSHAKYSSPAMVTVAHCQNMVGTIRLVERLRDEPSIW